MGMNMVGTLDGSAENRQGFYIKPHWHLRGQKAPQQILTNFKL